MKYSVRHMLTAAVLTLVLACTAFAGPADHNGGFYLRLTGGGGFSSTAITDPSSFKLEFSGVGGNMSAAIGGVVSPNLAIHGTVWGWLVNSPDAEINGSSAGQLDDNLNLSAFGGGATYYFMPANLYMTGSMGVGTLHTSSGSSDAGFVFDLGLGKEWWVSSTWGLGLLAGVNYHSIPDGGIDGNWSGATFLLSFSATYN